MTALVDAAYEAGDVVALCLLAPSSQQAREILYDDFGINDEDRVGILTHEARLTA